MLTNSADGSVAALEQLSALVDGELDENRVGQACQDWRGDGRLRSSWHAYHLIGDVLRSDDLAGDPAREARLLAALRLRLADEPVVLAPALLAQAPAIVRAAAASSKMAARRRRSWMMSSAVAAGFVAVAGVVFVTRAPEVASTLASAPAVAPAAPSAALASASPGGLQSASVTNSLAPAAADPQALVASGKLIRDVRLDRYLSAHKEFAGSSALGVPSGYLRNATADASDR